MMPVSLAYADLVRLIRVSIGAALLVAIGIIFRASGLNGGRSGMTLTGLNL